jgi:hypothetical protein
MDKRSKVAAPADPTTADFIVVSGIEEDEARRPERDRDGRNCRADKLPGRRRAQ